MAKRPLRGEIKSVLLGVALTATGWSCSSQEMSKLPSGSAVTVNGSDAVFGADSPTTDDLQVQIDKERRDRIEADERLAKMIDNESQARIAADKNLEEKISVLDRKVDTLKASVEAEITALKAADVAILTKVNDNTSKIDALRTDLTAVQKKAAELETALNTGLAAVRADFQRADQEILKTLSEKEAALYAKITATETSLKNEIKTVADNLAALTNRVNSLQADLARVNEELTGKINANTQALTALRTELTEKINAANAEIASLNTKLSTLQGDVRALATRLDAKDVEILTKIDKLFADTKALAEADTAIRGELAAKFREAMDAVEALRKYSNETFATKTQLQTLTNTVNGLSNTLNALGKTVTDLDTKLSKDIVDLRKELSADIAGVKATVDSLRTDFTKHVATYERKVAELTDAATQAAADVRKLFALQSADDETKKALNTALVNLTQRVTNLEGFAQNTRRDLEQKILDLEQTQDAKLKAELEIQKKFLLEKIAAEQKARELLQGEVTALTAEVERVKGIAVGAANAAMANAQAIEGLRGELTEAKKQFGTELQALEERMTIKINEIQVFAEKIAKGLAGLTEQFVQVTAELGELSQRDAATRGDIIRQLLAIVGDPMKNVDPIATAKAVEPQMELLLSRANALSVNLINIEQSIVNAIDPLYYTPESVNGIIADRFADVASSDFCGGVSGRSHDTASLAPSIADSAWFKHLGRAYIRFLLGASRTGDKDVDKVFFGVTKPLADGNSLESAIAMQFASSLATGVTTECDQMIDDWAKKILLGPDTDGVAEDVRARIIKNEGTQAEVAAIVSNLLNLTQAADDYEDDVKDIVDDYVNDAKRLKEIFETGSGKNPSFRAIVANAVEVRLNLKTRLAIAWESTQGVIKLAEKLAKIEEQTGKNTDAIAELKQNVEGLYNQINELRADMDKEINNLKGAVGNSFALIAEIARRLGYQDLIDAAKKSAKDHGLNVDFAQYQIPGFVSGWQVRFTDLEKATNTIKVCSTKVYAPEDKVSYGDACLGSKEFVVKTRQVTTTNDIVYITNTINITVNIAVQISRAWLRIPHITMQLQETRNSAAVTNADIHNWKYQGRVMTEKALGMPGIQQAQYREYSTKSSGPIFGKVSTKTEKVGEYTTTKTEYDSHTNYNVAGGTTLKYFNDVGPNDEPKFSADGKLIRLGADEIKAQKDGDKRPALDQGGIILRVFGYLDEYYIRVCNKTGTYCLTFDSTELKVSSGIYDVLMNHFMTTLEWDSGLYLTFVSKHAKDANVEPRTAAELEAAKKKVPPGAFFVTHLADFVRRLGSDKNTYSELAPITVKGDPRIAGITTNYQFTVNVLFWQSPIVLDLSQNDRIESVRQKDSKVNFDINNDGRIDRTAWVGKNAGFLALDLNGDGQVNNAGELFGDSTLVKSGKRAGNGYLALAQYDDRGIGYLDASAPVWSKLRVWTDVNTDGVSQADELHTLASLGVTRIDVEHSMVDRAAVERGAGRDVLFVFEGRYYGPSACGSAGCKTYDLYFKASANDVAGH